MELSTEQEKFIHQVANENGFSDYEVISGAGSNKGDNFLGIISNITIKSENKILDLVLKSPHVSEAFRKALDLHNVFKREIYVYKHVFEEFKKFQEEHNIIDPFISVPKAYLCSSEDGNEVILMENLKTQGYKLWNKKNAMNPGHVRAILKEYAKFHAVSLAMKDKSPERYKKIVAKMYGNVFEENPEISSKEKVEQYVNVGMSNGYQVVENDAELTESLKQIEDKVLETFLTTLKKEEYKLVINHGDCWCNNFLFKYNDSEKIEKPSSLRILDWQVSTVSSPAHDISYFFLANSSKEVFDDHRAYLKLYHDTLSAQLVNFGCDPQKLFPYSLFEEHIRELFPYGLFMSFIIVKLMVAESEEAPDLAEISEQNGDLINSMSHDIKNMDEYKNRIKNIILFLKDNNYI